MNPHFENPFKPTDKRATKRLFDNEDKSKLIRDRLKAIQEKLKKNRVKYGPHSILLNQVRFLKELEHLLLSSDPRKGKGIDEALKKSWKDMILFSLDGSSRINVDKAGNIIRLDLIDIKLGNIPPLISRLSKLESLQLGESVLGKFDQFLEFPPERKIIFPPELFSLPNLRYLYIRGVDVTESLALIDKMPNLEILCLERNGLTELPPSVAKLANLKSLRILTNPIKSLPKEIFTLENLEELVVNFCYLTDIFLSETLGLKKLEKINFSKNKLASLPDNFFNNLVNLKSLDLSENQLTNLPADLGSASNLEKLVVNENSILNLPASLLKLTHLKSFDCDSNNSSKLYVLIKKMSKDIRISCLSGNNFSDWELYWLKRKFKENIS